VSGHAAANSRESGDDPFLRGAVRIANDQCDRLANIRHLLVGESLDGRLLEGEAVRALVAFAIFS